MYFLVHLSLICIQSIDSDAVKDRTSLARAKSYMNYPTSFLCQSNYDFLTCVLSCVQNSIRHNLSLHSRFMRIQNEGTGKSSWWVINPDAKPGKAPRRRAGSMETKSYEKKRGRVKKKMEALRAALENGGSPLGGEDYLDPLAFSDFRPRTSSNASSCGRLSPIHAGVEPDLHDNQVPPMSPIPWGAEVDDSQGMYQSGEKFSELVDSLVGGMKLSGQDGMDMVNGLSSDAYLSNGVGQDFRNGPQNFLGVNEPSQFSQLPAPPPYPDRSPPAPSSQQHSPMAPLDQSAFSNNSYPNLHRSLNGAYNQPAEMYTESVMEHMNSPTQLSINGQQHPISSPDRSQQNSPNPQAFASHLSPQAHHTSPQQGMSPLNHQLSPQQTRALLGTQAQRSSPSLANLQQAAANASILRSALTREPVMYGQPVTTAQFTMGLSPAAPTTAGSNTINTNMLSMGLSPHHQIQQHLQQQQQLRMSPSGNNFLPETNSTGCGLVSTVNSSTNSQQQSHNNNNVPLDIDMDSLISVDYDMDQVIKQELRLEGHLDFNFDNVSAPTSAASQNIVHWSWIQYSNSRILFLKIAPLSDHQNRRLL